jgi:hypothetical protein
MSLIGWIKGLVTESKEPVTLTVKMDTPTNVLKLYLDKTRLYPNADGIVDADVPPGEYSLFWVVYGIDKQPYSVEITAPQSAVWKSNNLKIVGNDDSGAHSPVVVK